MELKDWKKLAEHEVYRYRDYQAYVEGMLEAGCISGERLMHRAKWTLAVERTLSYLKRTNPLKARFFSQLFGIEAPLKRRNETRTIIKLSMELNVSTATLYKWKSEALSIVLLAAAEAGALRPFADAEQKNRTP